MTFNWIGRPKRWGCLILTLCAATFWSNSVQAEIVTIAGESHVDNWDDDSGEDSSFDIPELHSLEELESICSDMVMPECTQNGTIRKVVVVLDTSKSLFRPWMYTDAMVYIQKLACSLTRHPASKIGLVTFGEDVVERVPLSNYSNANWAYEVEKALRSDADLGRMCCSPLAEALEMSKSIFNSEISSSEGKDQDDSEDVHEIVIVISDGLVYPNEEFYSYNGTSYLSTSYTPDQYRMVTVPTVANELSHLGVDIMFVGQSNKRGFGPDTDWVLGQLEGYCVGDTCFEANKPIVTSPYDTFALFPGQIISNSDASMSVPLPEWSDPSSLAEVTLQKLCEDEIGSDDDDDDDDDDSSDSYSSSYSGDDNSNDDDDNDDDDDDNDNDDNDDDDDDDDDGDYNDDDYNYSSQGTNNGDEYSTDSKSAKSHRRAQSETEEDLCAREPRDLIVVLDASSSISPKTFYGSMLTIAQSALTLVQERHPDAQTRLIALGQDIEELLPLETRSKISIENAIEDLRTRQELPFACCSPFALMFEEITDDLSARGNINNQPFVLIISDGDPYQNVHENEEYEYLAQSKLDRAEYLAKQIPRSAWTLKDEQDAIIAFVGVPNREGEPANVDYFTEEALVSSICSSTQVACYNQEVPIASEPTSTFAVSISNSSTSLSEFLSEKMKNMLCNTTATPLYENYPNFIPVDPEDDSDSVSEVRHVVSRRSERRSKRNARLAAKSLEAQLDSLLNGLDDPGVQGKSPRDLVVLLDTSANMGETGLPTAVLRIVLELVRTIDPEDGSQFGLIMFDQFITNSGILPLSSNSTEETMLKALALMNNYPCCQETRASVLAEAFRKARQMLTQSSKRNTNEQLVVVLTASNPYRSTHWTMHYAQDDQARYMARSVPLEGRALVENGVRVIVAGGPDSDNELVVNRAYFSGALGSDYQFCHAGRCFTYQGSVVSSPVDENLVLVDAWGTHTFASKILPLLSIGTAQPTVAPTPVSVPKSKSNTAHVVFVLDDSVSYAEHQLHLSQLQAMQTVLDKYPLLLTTSVYTSSCFGGMKMLLKRGTPTQLESLLQDLEDEPLTLANSTAYRCFSPMLIRAREITNGSKLETSPLSVVYLTGRTGRLVDLAAAEELTRRLPHSRDGFKLLGFIPGDGDSAGLRLTSDLWKIAMPVVQTNAEVATLIDGMIMSSTSW